jgi:hypothetical protein
MLTLAIFSTLAGTHFSGHAGTGTFTGFAMLALAILAALAGTHFFGHAGTGTFAGFAMLALALLSALAGTHVFDRAGTSTFPGFAMFALATRCRLDSAKNRCPGHGTKKHHSENEYSNSPYHPVLLVS